MRAVDTARYQGTIDYQRVRNAGYGVAIQKCTEAIGYKDPTYERNKKGYRDAGMLFGAYHFCRGTNARKEAEWFISQIGDIQVGELLVMDYEIYTLRDPASWCLEFSDRVEELVGFKPLLYTYHALLLKYNWKKLSDNGNGLWAARYGLQEQNPNPKFRPATGSWPFYMMWQYCSRGIVPGIIGNVDLNHLDINLPTLKLYGKPGEVTCNQQCQKHCQ